MQAMEFLSAPLCQRLALTLLHFLWQGLAVAALAVVLVRLLKLRPGPQRHGAYLLAMVVMAACPVATFWLVEAPAPAARVVEPQVPEVAVSVGREDPATDALASGDGIGVGPALIDIPTATDVPEHGSLPEMTEDAEQDRVPAESTRSALARYFWAGLPWVAAAWLVGVLTLSVRLLMGVAGMYRWRRRLESLPADLAGAVAALGERMGLGGFVRVFVSRSVAGPMVVGYLRPMVLLPAAMLTNMPPEMLEAIIAHELAHIRRLDLWVNLFQRVTETLLFYHPAVWWLSGRLRNERELCCDELAVAATGERLAYASALEQAYSGALAGRQPALAAGLGGGRGTVLARVRHVLGAASPSRSRLARSWPIALTLIAAIAGATVLVSCTVDNGQGNAADFNKAVVKLYVDETGKRLGEGRTTTIALDDPNEIKALASFFPNLGTGRTSNIAAGWKAGMTVEFQSADGKKVEVSVSGNDGLNTWSERHGDWPVNGDLKAHIAKLRKHNETVPNGASTQPTGPTLGTADSIDKRKRVPTAEDLARKGFPLISNPRREAIEFTAKRSLEEVADDLGDLYIMDLCRNLNQGGGWGGTVFWATALPPNVMVLRLIEEGRADPDRVSAILERAIARKIGQLAEIRKKQKITRTGAAFSAHDEALPAQFSIAGAFYVLANIDRLKNPSLLARWNATPQPVGYETMQFETWFIDYYFRFTDAAGSSHAAAHLAIANDRAMVGPKWVFSRWYQPWDVHNPMLIVTGVDVSGFETIKVLSIPSKIPFASREILRIHENFRQHVAQLRAVGGAGTRPAGKRAGAEQLQRLWVALGSADAKVAGKATAAMVAMGDRAVPFLEQRFYPPAADPERVKQLVARLDKDKHKYAVRKKAYTELTQLRRAVAPSLTAMKDAMMPRKLSGKEARARVEKRVRNWTRPVPGGDKVRRFARGIEVLARIPTARSAVALTRAAREDWFVWGKRVGGLQLRLRATKRVWRVDEPPVLVADAENRGERFWATAHVHGGLVDSPRLNIDGKWYMCWSGGSEQGGRAIVRPGRISEGETISLDRLDRRGPPGRHPLGKDGQRVHLTPGRHVLWTACDAQEITGLLNPMKGKPLVQLVSKLVIIEVVAKGAAPPATTRPTSRQTTGASSKGAPAQPAGPARVNIRGRVLAEPGGRGVGGIHVILQTGLGFGMKDVTGADGSYQFAPPASAKQRPMHLRVIPGSRPHGTWAPGVRVHVADKDVRAADLHLRLLQSISGVLRDAESKAPIGRQTIAFTGDKYGYHYVPANAQGRYRLYLPPGVVKLRFRGAWDGRYYPGTQEKRVTLAAGAHLKDVDLLVTSAPKMTGIVVFADGKPAAGAEVWLEDHLQLPLLHSSSKTRRGRDLQRLKTNKAGEFTAYLRGLRKKPGKETMQIRAIAFSADRTLSGSAETIVRSPRPDRFKIVLLTKTARVVVRVLGDDGKPVRRANLVVDSKFLTFHEQLSTWSVKHLGDGRYEALLVPGSDYRISAWVRGLPVSRQPAKRVSPKPGEQLDAGTLKLVRFIQGNLGDVPDLIKRLGSPKERTRKSAAVLLCHMGPRAVSALPALIERLKDPWSPVRYAAVGALGRIGPAAREAVPELIRVLREDFSGPRSGAAEALGLIGDPRALPSLREALTDKTMGLAEKAAEAIRRIEQPKNRPPATVRQGSPRTQPAKAATFGPPIERVVAYRKGFPSEAVPRPGPMYLDLDTGAYAKFKVLPTSKRIREAGVDVCYRQSANAAGMRLATSNMQVQPLADKTGWDSSPREVWSALAAASPYALTYPGRSTLAFKTRDGGIGILHILGFTKDRQGIRIRYKVLPQPKPGGATRR